VKRSMGIESSTRVPRLVWPLGTFFYSFAVFRLCSFQSCRAYKFKVEHDIWLYVIGINHNRCVLKPT
jgi:hypothetical protein